MMMLGRRRWGRVTWMGLLRRHLTGCSCTHITHRCRTLTGWLGAGMSAQIRVMDPSTPSVNAAAGRSPSLLAVVVAMAAAVALALD